MRRRAGCGCGRSGKESWVIGLPTRATPPLVNGVVGDDTPSYAHSNSRNRLCLSTSFCPEDWISQADAARMRGVTRQAIAKLVKANRLRSVVIAGHTLVSRDDVERYE